MKQNVKEAVGTKLRNARGKVFRGIVAGETMMLTASTGIVNAKASDVVLNKTGATDMDTLMGNVLEFIFDLSLYVGIGVLLFGIYNLYLSFTEDRPDARIKAISLCVAGIGLATLKYALETVGLINLTTGLISF